MIWIAGSVSPVVVVLEMITLVNLARYRHHLETCQLPATSDLGALRISALMWRISRSDALTESMEFDEKYPRGNRDPRPRC
jgi:hypothetical protein